MLPTFASPKGYKKVAQLTVVSIGIGSGGGGGGGGGEGATRPPKFQVGGASPPQLYPLFT